MIIHGDCLEELKKLPENSVDSVVTDPPYGLEFMGKEWNSFKKGNKIINPQGAYEKEKGFDKMVRMATDTKTLNAFQDFCVEWAKECLRVLKPGGYLLSFGGTRTYHRMACAIEDAGFEVRDMIEWVYSTGFPKSLNIGKAVDKLQGNEREVVASTRHSGTTENSPFHAKGITDEVPTNTKGTSEWEGWGTALKPAHEPICMARKPLAEKTVAENVLKYGTGGINIDESRVGETGARNNGNSNGTVGSNSIGVYGKAIKQDYNMGRFPANLIHDNSEEVRECFPETKGGGSQRGSRKWKGEDGEGGFGGWAGKVSTDNYVSRDDGTGNASRFFKSIIYQAKASKSERNKGCEGLEEKDATKMDGGKFESASTTATERTAKNNHPTVKPIALMEYLIKMVTPKGGIVLDPFMGSGSTGVACKELGYEFIGIEKEEEYIKIAEARINSITQTSLL